MAGWHPKCFDYDFIYAYVDKYFNCYKSKILESSSDMVAKTSKVYVDANQAAKRCASASGESIRGSSALRPSTRRHCGGFLALLNRRSERWNLRTAEIRRARVL